jgi:hypothetical protein
MPPSLVIDDTNFGAINFVRVTLVFISILVFYRMVRRCEHLTPSVTNKTHKESIRGIGITDRREW